MSDRAENFLAEMIEEFYNKVHRAGGPGGGQFDTAPGGAGASAPAKPAKAAKAAKIAAPASKVKFAVRLKAPPQLASRPSSKAASRDVPVAKAKGDMKPKPRPKLAARLRKAASTDVPEGAQAQPRVKHSHMLWRKKETLKSHEIGPAARLFRRTVDVRLTWKQLRAKIPKETRDAMDKAEREMAGRPKTADFVEHGGFKLPNGEYTKARQRDHLKVIKEIYTAEAVANATPAPGTKPTVLMTGGRSGSGKGTMLREGGIDDKHHLILNADEIAMKLPGYKPEHAALFHKEAADIALRMESMAMKDGLNIVLDGSMRQGNGVVARAAAYQKAGYNVEAHYVHVTPENSALRAAGRFMANTGKIDDHRLVPLRIGFNSVSNERAFDELISSGTVSKWTLWDNNGEKIKLVDGSESRAKK